MQDMMNFNIWIIQNVPTFLMEEPIIYFVGVIILSYLIKIIVSLRKGF